MSDQDGGSPGQPISDGGNTEPEEPPTLRSCYASFKELLTDKRSRLLTIWLVACPFWLLAFLPLGWFYSVLESPIPYYIRLGIYFLFVAPLSIAVFRPIRIAYRANENQSFTVQLVLRQLIDRYLPSLAIHLVLYGIRVIGLLMLVLPGIIAMVIFYPAYYIVAARKESVNDALLISYRWVKHHWFIVLAYLALCGLYYYLFQLLPNFWWPILRSLSESWAPVISSIFLGIVHITFGFLLTVVSASVWITIENYEESTTGTFS